VETGFAQYNQVFQQFLDPGSESARNAFGVNVVLVRLEDWTGSAGHQWPPGGGADAARRIVSTAGEFLAALQEACERSPVSHIVVLCAESQTASASEEFRKASLEAAELFSKAIARIRGAHYIGPTDNLRLYPAGQHDDPASNRMGHIPYTPEYYAALALTIARRVYSLRAAPRKVIVLDCDNTLWTGVAGEDGPMGVVIDAPRRRLQEFMLARARQGFILCLCSKNVEEDVFAVFESRPEMPLQMAHIVAHRINWRPKSENMASLAEELNLGLDSFIFVDDDPAVCAEVQANRPEVLTVNLPADAGRIPEMLEHIWPFDRMEVTAEDLKRTEQYKQNFQRERIRKSTGSFLDYLASLELKIDLRPLNEEDLPRVAQLTLRTNQFNCTTIRRAEPELRHLWQSGAIEGLTARVTDRFGDYGLVGAVLFTVQPGELVVDSFLMSCRALGRGVEHRVIATIGATAVERGCTSVVIPFLPTPKNRPAHDFLISSFAAYVVETGNGQRFQPPAAIAAALVAQHATAAPSEEAEAGTAVPATGPAPANWTEMAFELYRPRQVVAAVAKTSAVLESGIATRPYAAPETDMEKHLARIWEEILHLSPVSVEEDFFALGGDSFLAVRLFAQIEAETGKSLPLTALFEAPAIRKLAALLEQGPPRQWASLVPIQPTGDRPPLYVVHAAGGNVLFYKDLARYLPPDQPLYGLQAKGLGGKEERHRRVEDMARHYISEILAFQPVGPYYLGGSSFGGLVAYEMARQLMAAGEAVGLVALFDTYGKGYPRYREATVNMRGLFRLGDRFRHHWRNLSLLDGSAKWAYIAAKGKKAKNLFRRTARAKKDEIQQQYRAIAGADLGEPLKKTQNAIQEALDRYTYPPIDGPVTLFRAEQQPAGIEPDPALGWRPLVRGHLSIHEVPGAHGAVTVEPHAGPLVKKLLPVLDRARERILASPRSSRPALAVPPPGSTH